MAGLVDLILQEQGQPRRDMRFIKPLALAYLGDTVFDLYVRGKLVLWQEGGTKELHQQASSLVCAEAQARMMKQIMPLLSEEEKAVFVKARNQKSLTVPKHASLMDYKWATGFEALLGYLFLENQQERLYELMEKAVESEKEEAP